MITALIVMGIGILIGLLVSLAENDGILGYIGRLIVGAIIGFIVGIFASAVIPADGEIYLKKTTQLECVKDNSGISGDFFLGCGSIKGTMVYTFYEKLDSIEFRLRAIDCSDAKIVYSNESSKLEEYAMKRADTKHNRYTFADPTIPSNERYKIYVPKGSIKQNYIFDAE
jgi:hypothetical protein